jgi:hypothetical protein
VLRLDADWAVEVRDGKVFVKDKKQISEAKRQSNGQPVAASQQIVIIGRGAAGMAAAGML